MFPKITVIAGLLFGLVGSTRADSKLMVDAGLGYSCLKDDRRFHGGYSDIGLGFSTPTAFGIRSGYRWSEYRSKGLSARQHSMTVQGIYQLDYFHYVPWVGVGVIAHLASERINRELAFGLGAEFGINRLLDPSWSIGFVSGVFAGPTGGFPGITTFGLRIGYTPVLNDPFDP